MATATICHDRWGTYVQWYRDDDNDSGYGGNPATARWYCTFAEAKALATRPNPPTGAEWVPLGPWAPDTSPGSASWCETYSDNF